MFKYTIHQSRSQTLLPVQEILARKSPRYQALGTPPLQLSQNDLSYSLKLTSR